MFRASAGLAPLALVPLVLVACAVGPDYEAPQTPVPDVWERQLGEGLATGEASLETWWTTLDDPVLSELIARARLQNLDLRLAAARVAEARAFYGIARGERLPDIDEVGAYQRSRVSEDVFSITFGPSRTDNFFAFGFDASWEIDLFGRVRRSVESAGAGFESSVEDFRDVMVVLFAEVASAYVDVRALQARLAVAEANVESQAGTRALTQTRFDTGVAPELDVRQAELNLANTESVIPTLRILEAQAVHRLGVLLGRTPGELRDLLAERAPIPAPPELTRVGVPADLVRQRPDIRRAERELAAQVARIGVATADLYPRFTLLGSFGWEALEAHDVFEGANRALSFGPALRWNLFDGGRVLSRIMVEDARAAQAFTAYEKTVLRALEEVENAMIAFTEERRRRSALARSVAAAERSVELVKTLYTEGLTDFQNVLDTERFLFSQQDLLAESDGLVIKNLISMYRALGGGWTEFPEQAPTAPSDGEADTPSPIEQD